MYDSLKPPTDCLYKFLAIFGLAIIVVCAWAYFTDASRVMRKAESALSLSAIDPNSSDAIAARMEYKACLESLRLNGEMGANGFSFGWAISILGFALWYFKVQRHEDAILLHRSKLAISEPLPSPTGAPPVVSGAKSGSPLSNPESRAITLNPTATTPPPETNPA